MVKLGSGYVNPAHVLAIGTCEAGVRVHLGPGVFSDISGLSLDEVHAALFPPAPAITDAEAAKFVLEWAADPRSTWRDEIQTLARRALGRYP